MKAYESAKIGENRGRPRLWLEGFKASLAGFLPGIRFSIRKDEKRTMLTWSRTFTVIESCPESSRATRKCR